LQLSEKILTLADLGGQKTPVTPLLVTLFVRSALRRAANGLSFDGLPEVVPEVLVDYLRRLNASPTRTHRFRMTCSFARPRPSRPSVLVRIWCHKISLPQESTEALKNDEAVDQAGVLLDRLIASGVIERRTAGGHRWLIPLHSLILRSNSGVLCADFCAL
jgi:hypothetical protein